MKTVRTVHIQNLLVSNIVVNNVALAPCMSCHSAQQGQIIKQLICC